MRETPGETASHRQIVGSDGAYIDKFLIHYDDHYYFQLKCFRRCFEGEQFSMESAYSHELVYSSVGYIC